MSPQLSLAENLTLTIVERLGRPASCSRERDRQAGRLVRSLGDWRRQPSNRSPSSAAAINKKA